MATQTATIYLVSDTATYAGWDSGTYADIDEGTASPNDADYIESLGSGIDSATFKFDSMPSDFISMNSATIKIRGKRTSTKSSRKNLSSIYVYTMPDGGFNLLDSDSYVEPSFTTSYVTYSIAADVDSYAESNGYNTKAVWDNAEILIRTNSYSSGSVQVSAVQLDINYEAADFTVYDETGSGGVVAGGTSSNSSIQYIDAIGGAVLGTSVDVSVITSRSVSGGLVAGGLEESYVELVVGGGAESGGNSLRFFEYNPLITGGVLNGGVASSTTSSNLAGLGGVFVSGSTFVSKIFEVEGLNGGEAGGLSAIFVEKQIISTGGMIAGAVVDPYVVKNFTSSSGVILGGTAISTESDILPSSGGILGNASAGLYYEANLVSSGGSIIAGTSVNNAIYIDIVSTGAVLAGVSELRIQYITPISGGSVLGGTAISTENDILPSAGGILGNASAGLYYEANIVSNGGATLAGSNLPCVMTSFTGSGGIVVGGLFDDCVMLEIDSNGGAVLAGLVDAYVMLDIEANGGALLSGVAPTGSSLSGAGGAVLAGLVDACVMSEIIASGGLVTSGLSGNDVDFEAILGSGGIVLSGHALVNDVVDVSGGSLVGGTAVEEYVEFVILPEDTPGFKCQKGHIYTAGKMIKPVHSLYTKPKMAKKYKPAWHYRNHRICGPAIVPAITVCNQKLYNKKLRPPT